MDATKKMTRVYDVVDLQLQLLAMRLQDLGQTHCRVPQHLPLARVDKDRRQQRMI